MAAVQAVWVPVVLKMLTAGVPAAPLLIQ